MEPPRGVDVYRAVRALLHTRRWYIVEGEPSIDDHETRADRELRLTLRPWEPEPNTGDDPA